MSRSTYALRYLVVGEKDTEPEQWHQCVVEMRIKYFAIKRTLLKVQIMELEAQRLLSSESEISRLNGQIKQIDLEEAQFHLTSLTREFWALYEIYKDFGRRYSHQDLEADQPEYWKRRLTRQALQDYLATGRVGQGNQDALRQAGLGVTFKNGEMLITERAAVKLPKERLNGT